MSNCGPCGACCLDFDIPGYFMPSGKNKEAGTLCPHYDGGCSIHESKPYPCSVYRCHWLELAEAGVLDSTEWRPNEVGFIVSKVQPFSGGPDKGKPMFLTDGEVDDDAFLRFIEDRVPGAVFRRRGE